MKSLCCPNCELAWDIHDDAPNLITCPQCLAALQNPYCELEPIAPPSSKVIPVEQQAKRDRKVNRIWMIVLAGALMVGIAMLVAGAIQEGETAGLVGMAGILVSITAISIIVLVIVPDRRPYQIKAAVRATMPANTGVLDYQRPTSPPRHSAATFFAQAIGGIILGILAIPMLASAVGRTTGPQVLFVIPIMGLIVLYIPKVRGFGLGFLLSVPLAFLLVLGFCYFAK